MERLGIMDQFYSIFSETEVKGGTGRRALYDVILQTPGKVGRCQPFATQSPNNYNTVHKLFIKADMLGLVQLWAFSHHPPFYHIKVSHHHHYHCLGIA
jgi:hypothetical protein